MKNNLTRSSYSPNDFITPFWTKKPPRRAGGANCSSPLSAYKKTEKMRLSPNDMDKVAQLVTCWTSNQWATGTISGRGTLICPWARQFIPYCLAAKWVPSINKALLRACALYAASCWNIPRGIEMVSVCTGLLGEGPSCEHFCGYKTINRIPSVIINNIHACATIALSDQGVTEA